VDVFQATNMSTSSAIKSSTQTINYIQVMENGEIGHKSDLILRDNKTNISNNNIFDLSKLDSTTSISTFLSKCHSLDCVIYIIKVDGNQMVHSHSSSHPLLVSMFNLSYFPSLQELILMNIKIFPNQLQMVYDLLNPSLYRCEWKKLRFCHCSLEKHEILHLVQTMSGNVNVEVLEISNNDMDDDIMKALDHCLTKYENGIKELRFPNNKITSEGRKSYLLISFC
jgi:hypothetical protein